MLLVLPATHTACSDTGAICSNGRLLSERLEGTVFSPAASDARLSGLSLGAAISLRPYFDPALPTYAANVTHDTTVITITATTSNDVAMVSIDPEDGDDANGHQVNLHLGQNAITITVTALSGITQVYTVIVTRDAPPSVESITITVADATWTLAGPTVITPGAIGKSYTYTLTRTSGALPYKVGAGMWRKWDGSWRLYIDTTTLDHNCRPWFFCLWFPTSNPWESLFRSHEDGIEFAWFVLDDILVGSPLTMTLVLAAEAPHGATFELGVFVWAGVPRGPTLTVTVSNPPEITIARAGGAAVTEGEAAEFILSRTEPPPVARNPVGSPTEELMVTVNVTQTGTFISGTTPTTATFAAGNSTVTLSVATDDDSVDESNGSITATVSAGQDYVVGSADEATVTVYDNDPAGAGVTVSPTSVSATEGGATGSYTVVLDTQPTGTVTVTVGDTSADISASPQTLTFTSSDWDTAQTVTVTADDDSIDEDQEQATLSHTVSGYGSVTSADSVTVTVTDNDTAGVTVSPTDVIVTEGASQPYTVVLTSQPTADVTVTIGGESGDVSVNPSSLTFTAMNWNGTQTVTVSAAEDIDALADPAVTLTHTVSGGDYGSVSADDVTVTVAENDTPTLSVTDEQAAEDSGAVEFTVTLSTASSNEVTVAYTTSDGSATAGSDYTATSGMLTFPANSIAAQTISVTVTDDSIDEGQQETFTLTLSSASNAALAGGGSALEVTGTITDNDTAGVTVSPTSVSATEGGATGSYTVVLDTQPTGTVTVTVGDTSADISASPQTLTFTSSDWDTAQTVTATADDDSIDEDQEQATLSHTVSGYGSVTSADSVTVTVTDNDTAGVTVSPTDVIVTEGASQPYTVVLTSQPTADVTVTIGGESGDVSVNPSSLTFTAMNWNGTQTVTVSAAEDIDALADPAVTLTHTVSGGDYGSVSADDVTVTVAENDTPTLSVTDEQAAEDSGAVEFTVTLSTASSNEVTVAYTTSDGSATAGSDYTATSGMLTFPANSIAAQTISVTVTDDSIDEGQQETFTLTLSSASNAALVGGGSALEVTGTITGNDTAGVTVSPTSVSATEGGATGSYTVVLDTQPTGTVTVTVGDTSADISASPQTLTFTSSDWDTAQTVTATADDDSIDEDQEQATLSHTVSGYGSVTSADSVTVTVTDNDTVTVSFEKADHLASESSLNTHGSHVTLMLELDQAPGRAVAIPLTWTYEGGASAADIDPLWFVWDDDAPVDSPETALDTANPSVTFGAGDTRIAIRIRIVNDDTVEIGEVVKLGLGTLPVGVQAGAITLITVEIRNDDGLAATFPNSSSRSWRHTGLDDRPQLMVVFSEAVASFAADTPSVSVTGGSVESVAAHQEEGLTDAYLFTLTPAGRDRIELRLLAGKPCSDGGICTTGDVVLQAVPTWTRVIEGPVGVSVADAQATEGMQQTLDFTVTLDPAPIWGNVTVDYATEDGTATAVADYTATSGTLTFKPRQHEHTISVPIVDDAVQDDGETLTLTLSNAVEWVQGTGTKLAAEFLDAEATGTIRNTEELTAEFRDVPASHDGTRAFTFELHFSEEFVISFRTLRDAALEVTGGTVTRAQRLAKPSNMGWRIRVRPTTSEDATVVLPADRACRLTGAICTDDDRRLSTRLEATVAGPASANREPTGLPVISGAARVGEALTVSIDGIDDDDGIDAATYAYQWLAYDGTTGTENAVAAGASYTLTAVEVGRSVRVRVTFIDGRGTRESLLSGPTAPVVAAPVAHQSLPEVSIVAVATPVTEGDAAPFMLSRTGSTATALTVAVSVTETGTFLSGTAPVTAEFAPGATTTTLSVATDDDLVLEADGSATAEVTAGHGYTVGAPAVATVTVIDDDAAPVVATASPLLAPENGTAVATLQATDADTSSADLMWSLAGGADAGAFTLSAGGVLSFQAAPDFEAPGDADGDGDYEVTVQVSDGANTTEGALTVRLVDVDEVAPELSGATVDGAALTLTFNEALDGNSVPPAGAFTVAVDGTARDVEDLVTLSGSTATLTLAAPVASGATVTVGYGPSAGAGATPLRDAAGNAVAAFSDHAVANETPAPVNTPPTGRPTISGTAQVGETLTASVAAIDDADGLIRTTYAYQWLSRDGSTDTEIAGATSATYTLVVADVGKTIKVQVTFTDDGGTQESLLSEPTAVITDGTASAETVVWSADMTVEDFGTGGIGATRSDQFANVSASEDVQVKWLWYWAPDRTLYLSLSRELSDSYEVTLHMDDVSLALPKGDSGLTWNGVDINWMDGQTVAVSLTRPAETGAVTPGPLPEVSIAAAATPVTEGTKAAFTLSRTGSTAATLTVAVSVTESGTFLSGTPPATAEFAAGAAATTTLSVATDDDQVLEADGSVTATIIVARGYTVATPAAATVTIVDDDATPVVATASPLLAPENGTAVATLEATDADTPAADLVWSLAGGSDADVFSLTTGGTLAFQAAKDFEAPDDADSDGDYEVTVQVSDGANTGEAALTVRLVDVDEIALELSSATVNGATMTLTFSEALDGDSVPPAGAFAVEVDGAARDVDLVTLAGSTATLTLAAPVAAGATVTASYTPPAGAGATPLWDAAGNAVAGFSGRAVTNETPMPVNTPTGLPVISGTAQVGATLTASTADIEDADGLGGATFSYQWISNDVTADTESDIQGATAASYTLVGADAGKSIKVRVSFTDGGGTLETLTSAATATVTVIPVTVFFGAAGYTATEGGAAAQVAVLLSAAPLRQLTIALTATPAGGAGAGDYGLPGSVSFAGGESVQTIAVTATDDSVDDDHESVVLGFGPLPAGVSAGTPPSTTVSIADDDAAPVIVTSSPLEVPENRTAVAVLEATDADNPVADLAWEIAGGADADRFTLTADGVLAFTAAQDYEAPADADADGDYEVTVRVTDGHNPVTAAVTVRLLDVDEVAPTLASQQFSVSESRMDETGWVF